MNAAQGVLKSYQVMNEQGRHERIVALMMPKQSAHDADNSEPLDE